MIQDYPSQPGDIVRHRKTDVDYVVSSITGAVAGAGAAYVLLGLYNGRLHQIDNALTEDFLTVRRNLQRLSPDNVRKEFLTAERKQLGDFFDVFQHLTEKADDPAYKVFRDLLSLTRDMEQSKFSSTIIDLAEALVEASSLNPLEEHIFRIFREATSPDVVPDEFIWEFARELRIHTSEKSKFLNTEYNRKIAEGVGGFQTLDTVFRTDTGSIQGSTVDTLMGTNLFDRPMRPVGDVSGEMRLFGRSFIAGVDADRTLWARNPLLASMADDSPRERVHKLLTATITSKGGGLTPQLDRVLREVSKRTETALLKGDVDPFLRFLSQKGDPGLLAFINATARQARDSSAYGWMRQRNRTTATTLRDRTLVTPPTDVTRAIARTEHKYVAMTTDTLYRTVLRNKNLVNGFVGDTPTSGKTPTFQRQFRQAVGSDFIVLPKQWLQRAVSEDDIDIGTLIAEHQRVQAAVDREVTDSVKEAFLRRTSNPVRIGMDNEVFAFTEMVETAERLDDNMATKRIALLQVGSDLKLTNDPNVIQGHEPLEWFNPPEDWKENKTISAYRDIERFDEEAAKIREFNRKANPMAAGWDEANARATAPIPVDGVRPIGIGRTGDVGFKGDFVHEYMASFAEGMQESSVGVLELDGKASLIGTDAASSLRRQQRLASEMFNGGVVFGLDIEAPPDPHGRHILHELAVNELRFDGSAVAGPRVELKTSRQRLDAILDAVDKMKGAKVILTATGFDFRNLIEILDDLGGAPDLETDPALRQRYDEAVKLMRRWSTEKNLDVQFVYQLAGVPPGSTSQEAMLKATKTFDLNERIHKHIAEQDVIDMFDLVRAYRDAASKALRDGKIHLGEEVLSQRRRLRFFNTNSLSSDFGSVLEVLGMKDTPVKGRGVSMLFREIGLVPDAEGNLIETPGAVRVVSGESFSQLFSSFAEMEHIGDVFEKMADYQTIAQNIGSRRIRGLNPFSRTFLDETGLFEPTGGFRRFGPYARVNAAVNRLIPGIIPAIEEQQRLIGSAASDRLADIVRHSNEARLAALGIVDGIGETIAGLAGGDADFQRIISETMALRVQDFILSPAMLSQHERAVATQVDSELLRRVMAQGDLQQGGNRYAFAYASMGARLKELEVAAASDAAKSVVRHSPTDPRMRIKFGRSRVSARFNVEAEIQKNIENLPSKAAAEIIHDLHYGDDSKYFLEANQRLQDLGMGDEQRNRLVRTVRSMVSTASTGSDRAGYLRILSEIPVMEDVDIKTALNLLVDSQEMRGSIEDTLNEKLAQYLSLTKVQGDQELQQKATDLISEVFTSFRDKTQNQGVRTGKALVESLMEASDRTLLANVLRDTETSVDYAKASSILDTTEIDRVIARSTSLFDDVMSQHGRRGIDALLAVAVKAGDDAYETQKLRGLDVDEARWNAMNEALRSPNEDNVWRREFRERLAGNEGFEAPKTKENLHTAVTRTTTAPDVDPNFGREMFHRLTLRQNPLRFQTPSRHLAIPLMGVAAALGFAAGMTPKGPQHDAGNVSEGMHGVGDLAYYSRYSEVPGRPGTSGVWLGDPEPFALNITFQGYIANEEAKNALVRDVHNVVSNSMEVTRVNNDLQDRRNRRHTVAAKDLMR